PTIAHGSVLDTRLLAFALPARAAGSTLMPSTTPIRSDAQSGDTDLTHDGAFSRLDAYGGGAVQTPTLTTLDGVYLDLDAASSISTAQLTALTDGQIDFTGPVTYPLGNVTDLTHTTINV